MHRGILFGIVAAILAAAPAVANVGWRNSQAAEFAAAVRLAPRDAGFYYNRGNAYMRAKQYDRAVGAYSRAIRVDARYIRAFIGRAAAYYYMAQYERALGEWGEVIRLEPESAAAYGNRAWTYCRLGQPEKGLVDARRALEIKPYGDGYAARACNNSRAGKVGAAIADYEKAIRLEPGHDEADAWRRALRRLRAGQR